MIPKFKVWDKVAEDIFIPEVLELDKYGKVTGIFSKGTMFSIEDFEILQSTGLKDINGTEIYEGDILQVSRNHTKTDERYFNDEKINYVIEFIIYDDMEAYADIEHYGWCAVSETNTSRCTLIDAVTLWRGTVVGNIYEHPHILGEE